MKAPKNEREERWFLAVAGLITVLILMSVFTFNTDLKKFAERSTVFNNIGGALCIMGSWFVLWFGVRREWPATATIAWVLLLVFGLNWTCGFNFDYFGLK